MKQFVNDTWRTGAGAAGLALGLVFLDFLLGGDGWRGLLLFALAVAALWLHDRMVLALYRARPAGPYQGAELYHTVHALAQRAGVAPPRVYVIDSEIPNAFAVARAPGRPAVAATTGLIRALSREELAGVMAHELAHVQSRDALLTALLEPLAGVARRIPCWCVAVRVRCGSGRRPDHREHARAVEYAADMRGAEICGNPLWLASALRTLDAGNLHAPFGPAALTASHPPVAERVRRLEELSLRMYR